MAKRRWRSIVSVAGPGSVLLQIVVGVALVAWPAVASAQLVSGAQPGGASGRAAAPPAPPMELGPVEGLTSAWHPAPESATVPRGVVVTLRQPAPEDALVTWTGAVEVSRDEQHSVASCPLDTLGTATISVHVQLPTGHASHLPGTWMDTATFRVVDVPVADFVVGAPRPVVEPIDPRASNDELVALYFSGKSIADVDVLGPGRYLTSIRREVTFGVETRVDGYGPLIEWRVDGHPSGLGETAPVSFTDVGHHRIEAGPPVAPSTVALETYASHIRLLEPATLVENEPLRFAVITEPPGHEPHVRWLATTKYGSATPVVGQGPTFGTTFTGGDTPISWFGVMANDGVLGADLKNCTCSLGISGPSSVSVGQIIQLTATVTLTGPCPGFQGTIAWVGSSNLQKLSSTAISGNGISVATFRVLGPGGTAENVTATYVDGGTNCFDNHGINVIPIPPTSFTLPPYPQPPLCNPPTVCPDPTGVHPTCGNGPGGGGPGYAPPSNAMPIHGNQVSGGQIVLPHSGQETLDVTDVVIPGRDEATTLVIKRRHLTRVDYPDSIFGPAWDFNYRQTITIDGSNVLHLCRFGREDLMAPDGTDNWLGMDGNFGRMVYDGGTQTFTLRMAHGVTLVFHAEGAGTSRVGHLVELRSPNANTLQFSYESAGVQPDLLKRKLLSMLDSFGRDVLFMYTDPDFPDGVSTITDFAGRSWVYDYNAGGQVLSVRSPTVTSTGGLNDFPLGRTVQYTYRNHADPLLTNALTSVVYPNETAGGGQPRLAWTYHEVPGPTFGYVATHSVGNSGAPGLLAAGGTYTYTYTPVDIPDGTPTDHNTAVMEIEVADRRGTLTTLLCNQLGQVLEESVATNLGIRPGAPPSFDRVNLFNTDGHLELTIDPLGTTQSFDYELGGGAPRNSEGNNTRGDRFADARGADQSSLRTRVVYEPVFNKPFKITNPRGFEPGVDPRDFTTTFIYDWMEDLAQTKAKFGPEMGLSDAQLQALLDARGIVDVGEVNGDGVVQLCGNVVRIIHPEVPREPQAAALGLGPVEMPDELFRWNDYGQLVYHRDAEENATSRTYYSGLDPDGDGVVDVPGGDPTTGGYLKQVRSDFESAPGRQSGQDPTPVDRLVTYEYGPQPAFGFPGNPRGVPTAIIDGRGIEHVMLVNELDEVVTRVRAADVSGSIEPGLVADAYLKHTLRDANGNTVEERIQDKDDLDGTDTFIAHTYEYDILDQRRRVTRDSIGEVIVDRWDYDASQNLIRHMRGVASPAESTEEWIYDGRDLLFTHTRGVGTPDVSTTTTDVDNNGSFVAYVDADGGDLVQYDYDGLDRLRTVVDRVGDRTLTFYDANSNVVETRRLGPVDESMPGLALLSQEFTAYDTRNRPVRVDTAIFHYAGKSVGTIDDGALDPGDGFISKVRVLDRLGRAVGQVDADDDLTELRYDGLSRVLRAIDPESNESDFAYDDNDNLLDVTDVERAPGLIAADELFTMTYVYDSLDRRVRTIEPNGQETLLEYDSRDNRIRTTDELGNQTELRYDGLDRLLDTRRYLSATGVGATAGTADPAQGGGNGVITMITDWDDLDRMASRTDDGGQVTTYGYDDLDRRTLVTYEDGTTESWTWNADNELQTHTDQNGTACTYTHDGDGKPLTISVDYTFAPATTGGTTFQSFGYDGLDRLTLSTDDNDPLDPADDLTCRYVYDSMSRLIRETQGIGPGTMNDLDVDGEWQGAQRHVSTTYPDGRLVTRGYDGLDRLTTIVEDATASDIARYDYVGRRRDLRITHGNGTVLDKRNQAGTQTTTGVDAGYDANRRTVFHAWTGPGATPVTIYRSTHNGPGGDGTNRRASEAREHLGRRDDYTFDSAYRMTGFQRDQTLVPTGGVASSRTLDGSDNMSSLLDEGIPRMPMVDTLPGHEGVNQYSSFGGQVRTHDDASSLVDDGTRKFRFDFRDRLIEIQDSVGSTLATYAYDSLGRRTLRTTSGSTTRYVYGGWQVHEERDHATDTVLRQYVDGRGLDEHVQIKDHTQPGEPQAWYHTNSQGFTGALTDEAGAVIEHYEYSWLGEPRLLDAGLSPIGASLVGNPYMFQGRRLDPESGLYHARHRAYDPSTGRYLQLDPMGNWHHGQGNGLSAYGEDGWNHIDPMGLGYVCVGGIISGTAAVVGPISGFMKSMPTFKGLGGSVSISCKKCIGHTNGTSWFNKINFLCTTCCSVSVTYWTKGLGVSVGVGAGITIDANRRTGAGPMDGWGTAKGAGAGAAFGATGLDVSVSYDKSSGDVSVGILPVGFGISAYATLTLSYTYTACGTIPAIIAKIKKALTPPAKSLSGLAAYMAANPFSFDGGFTYLGEPIPDGDEIED